MIWGRNGESAADLYPGVSERSDPQLLTTVWHPFGMAGGNFRRSFKGMLTIPSGPRDCLTLVIRSVRGVLLPDC